MTRGPMSKTMIEALQDITKAGGTVERKPGGYWVLPGAKYSGSGWGISWGTSTIEALVSRGKMAYTIHHEGRTGKFPIAADVTLHGSLLANISPQPNLAES